MSKNQKVKKHFVTGATGFVGRHLVAALLKRGDKVFILVRNPEKAAGIFARIKKKHNNKLQFIFGDITKKNLGIDSLTLERIKSERIDILWHLAADMSLNHTIKNTKRFKCNVTGTRNVVRFANRLGCLLSHFSSSYICGNSKVFAEEDFDLGQKFKIPYEQTKFEGEKQVRNNAKVPYIIFRPSVVFGKAQKNKAINCNYNYYRFLILWFVLRTWIIERLEFGKFSKLILKFLAVEFDKKSQKLRLPLLLIPYAKGARLNFVSADYVVRAAVKVAQNPAAYNRTLHLTHPAPPPFIFVLRSIFADLEIHDVKFLALPPAIFKLIFKLAYFLAFPWRGYLKSALIYVSYFSSNHTFVRRNANNFSYPPKPISRKFLQDIHKYAFEKVFNQVKISDLRTSSQISKSI